MAKQRKIKVRKGPYKHVGISYPAKEKYRNEGEERYKRAEARIHHVNPTQKKIETAIDVASNIIPNLPISFAIWAGQKVEAAYKENRSNQYLKRFDERIKQSVFEKIHKQKEAEDKRIKEYVAGRKRKSAEKERQLHTPAYVRNLLKHKV